MGLPKYCTINGVPAGAINETVPRTSGLLAHYLDASLSWSLFEGLLLLDIPHYRPMSSESTSLGLAESSRQHNIAPLG